VFPGRPRITRAAVFFASTGPRSYFDGVAVHPKITLFGLIIGLVVGLGLALFLLGRITAGTALLELLVGVAAGIGILGAVGIFIVRRLPGSRAMEGVLHQDSQPSWDGYISAPARADLVGKTGVAASELRPVGFADIGGERVDVTTEGEWLPTGTPLLVVKAEAMRVVVRRAHQISA